MARFFPSISNPSHNHNHHHHLSFSSTNFSFLIASIAVLSIFALVIFLCTSSRKSNKSQRRNFVSKMNSNISSRAISMAKMISWRKVEAADEEDKDEERGGSDLSGEDDEEEEEVWRKTIIRGERCRPLEFSGKIDYDSDGNLLSDSNREFK